MKILRPPNAAAPERTRIRCKCRDWSLLSKVTQLFLLRWIFVWLAKTKDKYCSAPSLLKHRLQNRLNCPSWTLPVALHCHVRTPTLMACSVCAVQVARHFDGGDGDDDAHFDSQRQQLKRAPCHLTPRSFPVGTTARTSLRRIPQHVTLSSPCVLQGSRSAGNRLIKRSPSNTYRF